MDNDLSAGAHIALTALGLVTLGFIIAWRRGVSRELSLREELASLRAAPKTNEYRVERFGLVWFPTLTFDGGEKLVTKAAPGIPYCKACSKALAQAGGGWACSGCGERRADSVADAVATDSVMREAVAAFLMRHPDFRLAPQLQPLAPKA